MPSSGFHTTITVVLVAALLISCTFAGYYLLKYQQAQRSSDLYLSELKNSTGSVPITTNILLDFGNGTRVWYNGTAVQPGWSVYLATVVVTRGNMNSTWYPSYGEHLVSAIYGVENNANESWFLWSYSQTGSWQVAQEGADQLPASQGSVYAWSYCGLTPSYDPTCSRP